MIIGQYEKFCKNYELCSGYEKALNSSEDYFLHHIQGEYMSFEELKEYGWYYDCHPSCLKWVTKTEHNKIHGRCMRFETRKKISESSRGRTHSDETRRKIGESSIGRTHSDETKKNIAEIHKGKVNSDETRKKISDGRKGITSYRKGMTWKLVDGKRIWYKK